MTLYEIDEQIAALMHGAVNPETGEIEYNAEALESLAIDRNTKLEHCAVGIKNDMVEINALKAEEEYIAKRRKALENRVARWTDWLDRNLAGVDLRSTRVEVVYRASNTTETDEDFIKWAKRNRKDLLTIKPAPDPVPNKAAIAKAIKSGDNVKHAWIAGHRNIKILMPKASKEEA